MPLGEDLWCARRDSNAGLSASKADALSGLSYGREDRLHDASSRGGPEYALPLGSPAQRPVRRRDQSAPTQGESQITRIVDGKMVSVGEGKEIWHGGLIVDNRDRQTNYEVTSDQAVRD